MGRPIHKLSDVQLKVLAKGSKRKLSGDGGGLYFHVNPPNGASWIFRYTLDGRARTMGLGPYPDIGLKDARERATIQRRLKLDGVDPLTSRQQARQERRVEGLKTLTFKECAEGYIKAKADSWKNPKHAAQWPASLGAYAYPTFGDLPVSAVDTGLVLQALEPIWKDKTETATRVRQRIEAVLDWAKVRGYRSGENPARWDGHLEHQLASPSKISKVKHHAALPYGEIGTFMEDLRRDTSVTAAALEFTILTVGRTGEVIGARRKEIDRDAKVWTVPTERMKAGREHRVPLSDAALAVLDRMEPLAPLGDAGDAFVFPGLRKGKPLSNMTMLMALRRMGHDELTVHGFRSTFRDWAAETTVGFPSDVVEMALAHTINNKVEAAYRRGDLLEARRRLMAAWASACAAPAGGNVTVLGAATA
jgi:integrase